MNTNNFQMLKNLDSKYDIINLTLDRHDYTGLKKDEQSADIQPMPPLKGDEEEVK